MLGGPAQMRLELAEGQFDWVEVRGIFRQVDQRRPGTLDRLRDARDLVHWQIIHEHDLPGLERWDQALLHIREEYRAVHRSFDYKRRRHPASAQGAHEGHRLPGAM